MNPATHRANYQRESQQRTLTAAELHAKLGAVVAAGHGAKPVFVMEVEGGLTHARPVADAMAAEPYDGDLVWLI